VRAVTRGWGGMFDHVNQTGTQTQVKGPQTKNNANQVRMAPEYSTRYDRKGRKARIVQLRKENAATTKAGKLSIPG